MTALQRTKWNLERRLSSADLPPSTCGLIGAYCVCEALGVPYEVSESHLCFVNQRDHAGSVGEYLLSRSCAGMTAATLAKAVDEVSNQKISFKFIPTAGMTKELMKHTLRKCPDRDTVVVLTLNLQSLDNDMTPLDQLADAWHHHPVSQFVDDEIVSMMYPEVEYSMDELHRMLDCESCLLIRPADIVFQTSPKCGDGILVPRRTDDTGLLGLQKDPRRVEFNVIENEEAAHLLEEYRVLMGNIYVNISDVGRNLELLALTLSMWDPSRLSKPADYAKMDPKLHELVASVNDQFSFAHHLSAGKCSVNVFRNTFLTKQCPSYVHMAMIVLLMLRYLYSMQPIPVKETKAAKTASATKRETPTKSKKIVREEQLSEDESEQKPKTKVKQKGMPLENAKETSQKAARRKQMRRSS